MLRIGMEGVSIKPIKPVISVFPVILRELSMGEGRCQEHLYNFKTSQLNVSWFPTRCVMVEFIIVRPKVEEARREDRG